jgi:hypothetical protein
MQDMIPHIWMTFLYEALSISGNNSNLPAIVKKML